MGIIEKGKIRLIKIHNICILIPPLKLLVSLLKFVIYIWNSHCLVEFDLCCIDFYFPYTFMGKIFE